jgi:anti-sigma-K factor RskA
VSGTHDELVLHAPAYALGALDAEDRRAFEAHLETCALCAAEVRSLSRVTSALPHTVTPVSPRAELRNRVLTSVGARSAGQRSAAASAPLPRGSRSSIAWLPYAAILVLAAGFAVYVWDQRLRMTDLERRLNQSAASVRASERALVEARQEMIASQTTIGVLTAPDLARIDLAGQAVAPQASARALWSRQRGMVFTAANLPPLPTGSIYQVWVITAEAPTAPVSAGLLMPDPAGGATAFFMTPADIGTPTTIAVTIEPAGGAPGPTGAMYLVGKPA